MPITEVIDAGRGVAAHGLPRALGAAPIRVPRDQWAPFLDLVNAQRLTGLAVAALRAGRLDPDPGTAERLFAEHRRTMLWSLAQERALLDLARDFDRAGIDIVVLKGLAVARAAYPDRGWRPFGDLDLLVRGRDWRRACALLSVLGFRRPYREPRPGFVERFGHAAPHRHPDGIEVDLHRTLVPGPFGMWMEPDALFDRTASAPVGGRTVPRLDDSALFLHACVHAVLGDRPPRLLPLRDVAQTAWLPGVDWQLLADWSVRWRLRSVIAYAVETAGETIGAPFPRPARELAAVQVPRRERRALHAYTTERRERGGRALSTLGAIRGIRNKSAFIAALLFPRREFLEARRPGGYSLLRRWAVPLGWLKRSGSRT